jgi:hypothetical protein
MHVGGWGAESEGGAHAVAGGPHLLVERADALRERRDG